MADVRDILEIDHPVAAEVTKEAFLNNKKKNVFEKCVFTVHLAPRNKLNLGSPTFQVPDNPASGGHAPGSVRAALQ